MNQRQINILDLLSKKKKLDVNELSSLFTVSTVTIRKDLDLLEEKGLLHREHGFAIVNNEDNINYRLSIGYQDKYEIALKALAFIEPNETVMIESGSSCTLLALEIAKRNQNNTIITNSTFIARYLKEYPMTKIIVLGGEYQSSSEAIVGPLIKACLTNFNVRKLFIGTDGIDQKYGFTSVDYDRCETVKIMCEYAQELFVLSQSNKMGKHASYTLCNLDKADYLITDQYIKKEDKQLLETYHIIVK